MRNGLCKAACILLALTFSCLNAQQVPDTLYSPGYFEPAFKNNEGPVIYLDEAHHNFHTIGERYGPFAKLLRKDGFILKGLNVQFDKSIPGDAKIIVIANALSERDEEHWDLPNHPAFTAKEIKTINSWVKNGGALFIIADHMPFAAASAELAASFGFKFYDGFALDSTSKTGWDLFTRGEGNLVETDLSKGIDSIGTFTGQGFEIPEGAVSVLALGPKFRILLPERAWVFDGKTKTLPCKNKSQLAYLNYGKGKVVVSGEAAMFTAQLNGDKKVGMNATFGKNNYRLLLNIVRWLSVSE